MSFSSSKNQRLVSQCGVTTSKKGKAVIVFGIMFVNIFASLCCAAIQRLSVAQEAVDKGLAGQILCEASSEIDLRTTTV